MTPPISNLAGKRFYEEREKTYLTPESGLDSGHSVKLQKNNLINHATLSVVQENLKLLIKEVGFDNDFIQAIASEILLNKATVVHYLFHELLEKLSEDTWKNLNIEALLDLKDEEGLNIILTSIKKGKKEFLIFILQNSDRNLLLHLKDTNRRSMLHLAAIYGQDEIVNYLLSFHLDLVNLEDKDSEGLTAFHWAVHEGHATIIQKLLNYNLISQKWEVEKRSVSTLALAIASKNPHTVSLLLQNNHFKDISLLQPISPFGSVLHLAILLNEPKMIIYLLQTERHRIKDLLEITDKANRTPLQLAAFLGDLFAIKELYNRGAYINQGQNEPFGTPLHWAVKGKQPEAISLLLSLGADPNRNDRVGKAPIAYLNDKDLGAPIDERCKNILDNFMRLKEIEKVKEADFQERPPFNLIFEGNCTTLYGFIGSVQALESKKIVQEIRRYSGKGLGGIVAALLAVRYTASELENLSFKGLKDFFKPAQDLNTQQMQDIEKSCLNIVIDSNLPNHLPPLCDLTELRNDLEEMIFSKTGIKNLTLGQIKERVNVLPYLYTHLHVPIYSLLKKQNIFFNTEDEKYADFVLSDVLAASLHFLGLFKPASLRRKNSEGHLYADQTYGTVMSVPSESILVDQFDDFIYQEDPYFKGRMTNYRTCCLQLDMPFFFDYSLEPYLALVSKLIIRHLNREEGIHVVEKMSVGRVKKISLVSEDLKEDVAMLVKNRIEMLFSAQPSGALTQKNQQPAFSLVGSKFAWKFDIFRERKNKQQKSISEKKFKQVCTLPPFNIFFTGREKELQEIKESFQTVKKLAICGLGGIGKSTLSLKYAYSMQDYAFIHLIRVTTLGNIQRGLIELAGLLGIKKDQLDEKIGDLQVYLQRKDLRGLLIFDGLDEEAYLNELNSYLPTEIKCHVLISTRIGKKAKEKGFKRISLDSFTHEEAVYYLTKGLKAPLQEKIAAETLVKEIGRLPLTLSHIARYLDQEKITLQQYKDCFQKKYIKVPGKNAINLPSDEKSVFITWKVSLRAIKKDKEAGDLALSFMHFIAILGETDIPLSLLAVWAAHFNSEYGLYELKLAIKLLKDYDFLKEKTYKEDSNIYYNIHSLVQKVIAYQLTQKGKEKEVIRKAIGALHQEIYELRRPYRNFIWEEENRLKYLYVAHLSHITSLKQINWHADLENYTKILSHLGWLSNGPYHVEDGLKYINEGIECLKHLEESKNRLIMAELYVLKGSRRYLDVEDRLQMVKKALEIRLQAYAKDSEYIIECHDLLGFIYRQKEDNIQSLEEYKKVLEWKKINLNITNMYTTESYNDVIDELKELGKKEEVLELAKERLKSQKEALGEDGDDISASYKQVIDALMELEKKEDALEIANEMLKTRRQYLGEKDEWTSISYKSVIDVLESLERREGALEVAKEMLKNRKAFLGEGAQQTWASYQEVIEMLKRLERKEEALEVAKEMLKTRKESVEEGDVQVLASYKEVAGILKGLERKEEALEVLKAMLRDRKALLGEGDDQTLAAYQDVIEMLKGIERKEEALEVAKEMLKTRKEFIGERSEQTLASYQEVIKILKGLNRKEEALEVAQEMLKTRKESVGEGNQQVSASYTDVIEILKGLDRKEEALEVAKEMLKTRKESLEEGDEQVLASYKEIIEILKGLNRKEEALEVAKEMLKTRKESVGEGNQQVLASYTDVIEILKGLNRKEEALEMAKEMLKTRKVFVGEGDYSTFISYKSVIKILKELGRKEEALEVNLDRLKAIKEALGEKNLFTYISYNKAIKSLKQLGRKEKVLDVVTDTLGARKKFLPKKDRWISESYIQVIDALKDLEKKEEALEVAQEMLKTRKEFLGEENWYTSISYRRVIDMLYGYGRKEEAIEVAKELLKNSRKLLIEGDEQIVECYHQAVDILKELGRNEEALEIEKELLS